MYIIIIGTLRFSTVKRCYVLTLQYVVHAVLTTRYKKETYVGQTHRLQ